MSMGITVKSKDGSIRDDLQFSTPKLYSRFILQTVGISIFPPEEGGFRTIPKTDLEMISEKLPKWAAITPCFEVTMDGCKYTAI